jgi:hypothetical protein
VGFFPQGGALLTLEQNEVHRLNPVPQGIRVLSGLAWITWKGDDIVLNPGRRCSFRRVGTIR